MQIVHQIFNRWKQLPQKFRFLIIGCWNTIFGLLVFAGLHFVFSGVCHYIILLLVANELAIINAYVSHKFAVFTESPGISVSEVVRFHSVYLVSVTLGVVITFVLVDRTHMYPVWANGVATGITVVISYFAHKSFSFATRRPS